MPYLKNTSVFEIKFISIIIIIFIIIGISNLVINWIHDFITGRRYRVRVNLSYSLWSWVTSGIPKGVFLVLYYF